MKRSSKRFQLLLAIHKYLGLATGLIVLLVSLTGAAWVFRDEVQGLTEPTYECSAPADGIAITASRAKALGEAVFAGQTIHGTLYGELDAPVEVIFYDYEPRFYRSVFLHPSTGEVLHVKDHLSGFFAWVLRGHMYLWLPPDVGTVVVKYGIVVFLFIILSGIIIWGRGKLKNLRHNLTLRWKPTTGWRRKNYDLHALVGTYIYVFAFLFAFTGSVIGLQWFSYLTYKAMGGEGDPSFFVPANVSPSPTEMADGDGAAYDALVPRLKKEVPDATGLELHYPYSDSSSVYVEIMRGEGTAYRNDYRYFDQYSLVEIESPSVYAKYADADFAKFVLRMNYDIHIGAIGGLFGKILAFIASLVVASLPVTGALLYYGRRKKRLPRRSTVTTEPSPARAL